MTEKTHEEIDWNKIDAMKMFRDFVMDTLRVLGTGEGSYNSCRKTD